MDATRPAGPPLGFLFSGAIINLDNPNSVALTNGMLFWIGGMVFFGIPAMLDAINKQREIIANKQPEGTAKVGDVIEPNEARWPTSDKR